VIGNLDHCDDSRTSFIEALGDFTRLTESRCKFAITSNSTTSLQTALGACHSISSDDHPEVSDLAVTRLASDINLEVSEPTRELSKLPTFKENPTNKFLRHHNDSAQPHLIVNRPKLNHGSPSALETRMQLDDQLQISVDGLVAQVLANVPSNRHTWARKVLLWTLFTHRPLTIWELGITLALEVDTLSTGTMDFDFIVVFDDVIADLNEFLFGIFVITHNEIHFRHVDIRPQLLAVLGAQEHLWYNVKATAHQEITDICLLYLSLQQKRSSASACFSSSIHQFEASVTTVASSSLHLYAINYWPSHFVLIPENLGPTTRTLEFVQTARSMRWWAETQWWFSNPFSRTDRTPVSLLPIYAALGLQDLVQKELDLEMQTVEARKDRALALTEAARNGQVKLVCKILSFGGYSQADLHDALAAGISAGDVGVLNQLVVFAIENIEGFKWPSTLIYQAAELGVESVVKKILSSGASFNPAITIQDITPLQFAAESGHEAIVKILIERYASLAGMTQDYRAALQVACGHGDPVIVAILLDILMNTDDIENSVGDAMCFACTRGNHKAVEILTKKCDLNRSGQGGWPPLAIAADKGFVKSAQVLLQHGANLEGEGPEKCTSLRYAVRRGHLELSRLLLEKGADPNTPRGGSPILFDSANRGDIEAVKLLITYGANINAVDELDLSVLISAVMRGHVNVAAYLLDSNADANYASPSGATAIHWAAASHFADLVQLLINNGADLSPPTTHAWLPIHYAYQHPDTTRVLMENGADANITCKGLTPLFLAASGGEIKVVEVLLRFHPDLEIVKQGGTALTAAVTGGHTEVVRMLLEDGANVNHTSNGGQGALHLAVRSNSENLLRTIMEYHPNLNLVDDDGDTALHYISSDTCLGIAKILVNGGLSLESRNYARETPLCKAAMNDNLDIVKYLIAKKAEVNLLGGKYGGPLHVACHFSIFEVVKTLVAAGADVDLLDSSSPGTPLQSACYGSPKSEDRMEEQTKVISYLINEAKADVTVVGGLKGCALNAACIGSTPEVMQLILQKGADIETIDGMGCAAVHFAAAKGFAHFQIVLDAGGNVEQQDQMGRTALHWAAIGGQADNIERIFSLSRGLLDQPDNDGWTPLLWAARGGAITHGKPAPVTLQEEIIGLLLDRGANPCVIGNGLDRKWSVVKIGRYHELDDSSVQLLLSALKEKLVTDRIEDDWDEALHASRRALKQTAHCDGCLTASIFPLSPSTSLFQAYP